MIPATPVATVSVPNVELLGSCCPATKREAVACNGVVAGALIPNGDLPRTIGLGLAWVKDIDVLGPLTTAWRIRLDSEGIEPGLNCC
ncbi:unnamed protein product [Schistosoma curassoni]|uniref:Amidase domain-containing protein n=1 Tax=Schistosoma curassoni TaxID=6186 RepID=A0A183JEG9_9TREM|nr:unnamed protein product [Schistosoma curassoni]